MRINKSNNLGWIRLLLAVSVFVAHFNFLSGDSNIFDSYFFNEILTSSRAVKLFFIISGILIYISAANNSSKRYFEKRFFRIYPLYFIVISISLIIGFLSDASFKELALYYISNLLFLNFLQPSIDGLFQDNYVDVINGSLWTLKIEVMFYIFVYLIVRFFPKNHMVLFFVFSLLSALLSKTLSSEFLLTGNYLYSTLNNQFPSVFYFFFSGIIISKMLVSNNNKYVFLFILHSFLVYVISSDNIEVFVLSNLLLVFGFVMPPIFKSYDKVGDLSYGVYILHFPLIQCYLSFSSHNVNVYDGFMVLFIVIFSSFFAWNTVEKKMLAKRFDDFLVLKSY